MGCCASAESAGRHVSTAPGPGGTTKVTNIPLFGDPGSVLSGAESGQHGVAGAGGGAGSGAGPGSATNALRRFTLRELQVATGRFKRENELGEGSFGKVYKGSMEDWLGELPHGHKRVLAVKVLDENSFQGFGEWMAEVLLLGRLQHSNLVRLLGYCSDKDEAILVYEFLHNGSLENWLFSTKRRSLTWEERMRIARDATEGLGYLHAQNIIHRDFKSCNILLDQQFTAKLTDFGMATTGPEQGQTHVSTRVMGTVGYLDPKYMETGHLTPKSDIYALGVVFLELLTGRPPTARDAEEDDENARLTTWIRPHFTARRPDLGIIMDPRLEGRYSPVAAHKLLVLAKHCVSEDPQARPQISEMLKTLRQIVDTTSVEELQQQQQRHLVEAEQANSVAPLDRNRQPGSQKERQRKSPLGEDSSFDATRKVFGEVVAPR